MLDNRNFGDPERQQTIEEAKATILEGNFTIKWISLSIDKNLDRKEMLETNHKALEPLSVS